MSEQARFEKEREKTLKELPDSIKQMFGQIGFYRQLPDDDSDNSDDATNNHNVVPILVPVLIMNPYDVPPKPVRDIYWFDFFSRAKRSKSLDKLAYLVYHYGSDDPDDCYSFVQQEDFIPYEDGKENGCNKLPEGLESKPNKTQREKIRVRGIQEMEQDLEKDPGERKRGVTGFLERHETKMPPTRKRKAS